LQDRRLRSEGNRKLVNVAQKEGKGGMGGDEKCGKMHRERGENNFTIIGKAGNHQIPYLKENRGKGRKIKREKKAWGEKHPKKKKFHYRMVISLVGNELRGRNFSFHDYFNSRGRKVANVKNPKTTLHSGSSKRIRGRKPSYERNVTGRSLLKRIVKKPKHNGRRVGANKKVSPKKDSALCVR